MNGNCQLREGRYDYGNVHDEQMTAMNRRNLHFEDADEPTDQLVRETLFDSADWLDGVDLPEVEGRPTVLFLAGGPLTGKDTVLGHLGSERSDLVPRIIAVLDSPATDP